MTTLNTIIEEEKKEAREKLLAVTSSGDVWNTDDFANELITTAMQRAFEAGKAEEEEHRNLLADELEAELVWMDCPPSHKSVIKNHIKSLRTPPTI